MTRIAAVILAGGKAERLGGRNKALLRLSGETLLERACHVAAGCDPILVAIGKTPFDTPGCVPIVDLESDYAGPLAGVAAAVAHLAAAPPDLLFTLAVDTPFFPIDFIARALPLVANTPAVIAAYDGQSYPTNGLWRFAEIRSLAEEIRQNTAPRSLKRLVERLGATQLDYLGSAPTDPFLNANTPEDAAFLGLGAEPSSNR
jgi:molybdopterin-guanine dinucleotide biosynthesis protein A